jgi:rare lipoprotein A
VNARLTRQAASAITILMVVATVLVGCAQAPVQNESTAPPPPAETVKPAPTTAPTASSPEPDTGHFTERGRVSLYGADFAGRKTASGEPFDPGALTMAHRTLPFGTVVRVINVENQRSVDVTVNDRGPYVPGRIADLSLAAARKLGMVADGVVDAILEVIRR